MLRLREQSLVLGSQHKQQEQGLQCQGIHSSQVKPLPVINMPMSFSWLLRRIQPTLRSHLLTIRQYFHPTCPLVQPIHQCTSSLNPPSYQAVRQFPSPRHHHYRHLLVNLVTHHHHGHSPSNVDFSCSLFNHSIQVPFVATSSQWL